MPNESNQVFLISYNRPRILARTLEALRSQTCGDFRLTLVQDGPRYADDPDETDAIRQCVDTFRRMFPGGEVLRQEANAGAGLNILRAQERAFRELGLAAAFFFEDDLVPHRTYLEQLIILREALLPHRRSAPYFACYGAIHGFSPDKEHLAGSGLRFMDYFWGYGLFREHWEEEQALLQPYFAYLRSTPYRDRDDTVVHGIFRDLGHPRAFTSQDSARHVALLRLGRCALTTVPRRAAYIGEDGEHSTLANYDHWRFRRDALPHDMELVQPSLSSETLGAACLAFPEWLREMDQMPPNLIACQKHEIARLSSEVAVHEHHLTAVTGEAAALRRELRAMRESTCWRATLPFQRVADGLGLVRRRMALRPTARLRRTEGVVALDISNIWHADSGTGIQRVVRNIATQLATRTHDNKKIALINFASGTPLDVTRGFLSGERTMPAAPLEGLEVLVMLDSSYNLAPPLAPLLRQAKRDGIRIVSVCHDLLPVRFPRWFTAMNRRTFRRWLQVAAGYSSHFACVSGTTAEDLRAYLAARSDLPIKPGISTWPLGCDFASPLGYARNGAEGLAQPYALMVGTVEPRKNHSFVLEAFGRLHSSGRTTASLVVVGRRGWKCGRTVAKLRQAEAEGWLIWLEDGISDGHLASLYRSAACAIQASRAEGFGLPVAEAANFGKPVVLSDIPIFREIVRAHGYFFTLDDHDSFARALALALQPGIPATKTKAVSWRESAEAFWDICLGNPGN